MGAVSRWSYCYASDFFSHFRLLFSPIFRLMNGKVVSTYFQPLHITQEWVVSTPRLAAAGLSRPTTLLMIFITVSAHVLTYRSTFDVWRIQRTMFYRAKISIKIQNTFWLCARTKNTTTIYAQKPNAQIKQPIRSLWDHLKCICLVCM